MSGQEANVLVTGGAGCVGHYLIEQLLECGNYRVHALLRDPGKLRADLRSRVEIHAGDLADPAAPWWEAMLPEMDFAILAAASWGGPDAVRVNAEATWRILDSLADRCRRAVYLSTASVLAPDGTLLAAAAEHGTEYIRSKHAALAGIDRTRSAGNVVTLCPTVILGGDARHPFSPAARGLRQFLPFIGLLRFLTLDVRFHVVHAFDVARAAVHFLETDERPRDPVVLGIPALDAGEALALLGRHAGHETGWQLDLTPLALALPALLPHKFTSWDRYCLAHRNLTYPVADLEELLDTRSGFETLSGIVAGLQGAEARVSEVQCAPSP